MLTRSDPPTTRGEPALPVFTALVSSGMPYAVVRHTDLPGPVHGPADVARGLPMDLEQITKTLLVAEDPGHRRWALVVLSVTARADLESVAASLDWPGAMLAPTHQLYKQLHQPVFAVSPIGSDLPVLVDPSLATGSEVLVGSGTIGVEIGIDIYALVALTGARWAAISAHPDRPGASAHPGRDGGAGGEQP
jgi:prolyl-tRNA editing enzyme YbaK/EbsC (Cys-tRNA(Pro) deacylase)